MAAERRESEAHGPPPGGRPGQASEAPADGSAFEALRDHLADGGTQCVEWCPICRTADLLRASATPELREQWYGIQREALLAIRALIDHYLDSEGPDHERGERTPRVRDIPIE